MANKRKLFENSLRKSSMEHGFTYRGQIWWKSAVEKLPKSHRVYRMKKISAPRDSSKPSILPPLGQSRPKFPEHCRPLTRACVPNLVAICWSYSWKINVKNCLGSLTTVVRAQNDTSKTANITYAIFDRTR